MRKRERLFWLALLTLLVLVTAVRTARAVPAIYYVDEGRAAVLYCAGGVPDAGVSADGRAAVLVCRSPVTLPGERDRQ